MRDPDEYLIEVGQATGLAARRIRGKATREPCAGQKVVCPPRGRSAHPPHGENRLWGAERIRGELLKLGVGIAKRTVQRYMRGSAGPVAPRPGQRRRTFLRNHTVWARDFLEIYDIWFRPIYAFFIVDVNAKRVVHVSGTRAPTQAWDRGAASVPCPRGYALSYFNGARPHQGIGQRIPTPTERPQARLACSVDAIPVLGGLHHDYRAAA